MTRKNNSKKRKRAKWPFACLWCCKLQQVPPALQLFRHHGGVPKRAANTPRPEEKKEMLRGCEFVISSSVTTPPFLFADMQAVFDATKAGNLKPRTKYSVLSFMNARFQKLSLLS